MVFRYPSTYTPSSTGTCVFTISKVSSEVCQVSKKYIAKVLIALIVPAPSWLWDNVGICDNNRRRLYWQFHRIRWQQLFFISLFSFQAQIGLGANDKCLMFLRCALNFSLSLGQTGKTVPSICGTNTGYHSKSHSSHFAFHFHFPSVRWVWSVGDGHNLVDAHTGINHLNPQVEHPRSADSLHCYLQVPS